MARLYAHGLRCLPALLAIIAALSAPPAQGQMIRKDALLPLLPERSIEPFGLSAMPAPAGPLWIRWRQFDAGVAQDTAAIARCRAEPATCSPAESRMVALIDTARSASGRAKFGLVNREINLAVAYTSDSTQHGAGDVWSNALATLTTGQGDCEDFAIVKYLTLREAGIPAEDLRLLVGRVTTQGEAHAVLAARLDGRWLILDNRRMAMVEDQYAVDLAPLFALDGVGVKQFGTPTMLAGRNAQRDLQDIAADETPALADVLPLLM
jgi:predicted transglutaminase-like cysteine proteinase